MRVFEKSPCPRQIRFQPNRDHPAESSHLLLRESVLRMFLQSRITHGLDFRFGREPVRDFHRILAMPLHPQRKRLQSAEREKTVEWSGNRADRILEKCNLITELLVFSHNDDAANHIGMAIEIFRRGMND